MSTSNDEEQDQDSRPTLLLVDDTSENIVALNGILRDEYRIKSVASCEQALLLVRGTLRPDLILLAIKMPGMDGHTLCRHLKLDPATADIPVIFISARNEEADETMGFSLGAVDHITLPVRPLVLLARIRTQLNLLFAQRELAEKNRALQEANRLRDQVEQITRHDLRTPLTAIIAGPPSMSDPDRLNETDRRILRNMEAAGRKMLEMINRSLDLYKMETGLYRLHAEPINLLPILLGAVNDTHANPSHRSKSCSVRIEGTRVPLDEREAVRLNLEFWALAEEILCYPMFSNLLKNAFESTADSGEVRLDLRVVEDMAQIDIHNPGQVPEEIRERFFDKFVTHGKEDGTGLGSYSAALCARTQNGSVELLPQVPGEVSIRVRLPRPREVSAGKLNDMLRDFL